ncbi:hypothetical protein HW555_013785 [Spodoptera exigua]|uniref:Uncharacterized protein n=1 Tax=Spodoptera exigua TaxID=7107 RepID=A0A835G4Q0_SPOEX|nr:hypothetical protein HW555_013785 [Spodoptera exigua]KAH9637131.1 hypothetical protein HF086_016153 [Spodoptera exigua]
MPYVMVIGSVSVAHLSNDEGATVYGLNTEERNLFIDQLNKSYGHQVAWLTSSQKDVQVRLKGLTLVVVNRIHALFGYDVVSHAMTMTNANRELVSFTMYKKTSASSQSQRHSHSQVHATGHSHSPRNSQEPQQTL